MTEKNVKVIFDTNVWISFLIGKRLYKIKQYILDGRIQIITCEQLITEIRLVTGREKMKKYFASSQFLDVEKEILIKSVFLLKN